jgi:hypothetical protein
MDCNTWANSVGMGLSLSCLCTYYIFSTNQLSTLVVFLFVYLIVHLDVRDGKVWIQHNATEEEADDLMGLGIEGQLGCIVCLCALVRILRWFEGGAIDHGFRFVDGVGDQVR